MPHNSKKRNVIATLKRRYSLAAFVLMTATASPASADDLGVLRGLQVGPVGDSPQFAELAKYEAEGALTVERTWGKYTVDGDPASKVSSTALRTILTTGAGIAPNSQFQATVFARLTLASDYDETRDRTSPKFTLDAGLYRHEIAGLVVFRQKSLVAGGGLGLLLLSPETRELSYDTDRYKTKIGSAAMPVLRLFGGWSDKTWDATLGVRLFSKGDAVVDAEDEEGNRFEYDIVRRAPAEVHADASFKLSSARLVTGLAYVFTGQSSEQVDEFSMEFVTNGNHRQRRLMGDERRHVNHVRLGFGGLYEASEEFTLEGGIQYIQPSYKEPHWASLDAENIGGVRIDAGTRLAFGDFHGYFHTAYLMDSSVTYTAPADRDEQPIKRTQKPPLEAGDRVKISQGLWNVTIGGGMVF